MNPSQMPIRVVHIIPDDEVHDRVEILMNALVVGGEDPADIDLTDLAVQFFLRDVIYKALAAGLSMEPPQWSPAPNGDIEVIFPFKTEEAAMLFKLWFH